MKEEQIKEAKKLKNALEELQRTKIKTIILEKLEGKNISEEVQKYIVDYLYYIQKLDLLPETCNIEVLLERLSRNINSIIFFKTEDQENYPEIANFTKSFKGYTTKSTKNLYIRTSNPDWEIVFYHELTHALQGIGLSYKNSENRTRGSLENEAITQFVADMIYQAKQNKKIEYQEYDSGDLRMLPGTKIISDLTNYQAFDYVFNKFLNSCNLSRKDAAKIMFLNDVNKTKEFFDNMCKLPKDTLNKIYGMLQNIYVTDLYIYTREDLFYDKETKQNKLFSYKELLLEKKETILVRYEESDYKINAQSEFSFFNNLIKIFDLLQPKNDMNDISTGDGNKENSKKL